MNSTILKIAGVNVTEYAPASPTKNTILFMHGLGGATKDEGLKQFCKNGNVNAWVYCPTSTSGWWNGGFLTNAIIPIIDYICAKHQILAIDLLTGLSSGGNGVYSYLVQTLTGHDKVKKFAPLSINSRQFISSISKSSGKPVWHFHGKKDVSPNAVTESVDFITAYNTAFANKAKRTVFTNLGHNTWDTVYGSVLSEPVESGSALTPFTSLFEWALSSEEAPAPQQEEILEDYILNNERITVTAAGTYKSQVVKQ